MEEYGCQLYFSELLRGSIVKRTERKTREGNTLYAVQGGLLRFRVDMLAYEAEQRLEHLESMD